MLVEVAGRVRLARRSWRYRTRVAPVVSPDNNGAPHKLMKSFYLSTLWGSCDQTRPVVVVVAEVVVVVVVLVVVVVVVVVVVFVVVVVLVVVVVAVVVVAVAVAVATIAVVVPSTTLALRVLYIVSEAE